MTLTCGHDIPIPKPRPSRICVEYISQTTQPGNLESENITCGQISALEASQELLLNLSCLPLLRYMVTLVLDKSTTRLEDQALSGYHTLL